MAGTRSFWRQAARVGAAALAAYMRQAGADEGAPEGPPGPPPMPPAATRATPAARGFEPEYTTPTNRTGLGDMIAQADALRGKTTYKLGPTNPRWSTFSGEMTPENITSAIDVANTGQPFQLQDMYRRAVENDAHLGAVVESAFDGIIARQDRTEPPRSMRRDKCAISVANWQRAVREQVDDFDQTRYALLWAEGAAYSGAENIFGDRPITWFDADGKRITRTYTVPVKLEIVEGRSFRFDQVTDEPLLWLQGDYVRLPPAKFVFHRAHGVTSLTERRGFMRSCLYLHAMKQWTLRDMAEYLHMYGLPQLIAEYDPKQYKYPEAKALAQEVMKFLGEGGIPTTAMGSFTLRSDTPTPQWALVHRDAAQFLNSEITKRVLLGLLTMEASGGSYGLGEVHADSAYDGRVLRGLNLCNSLKRGLWAPTLAMNVLRLAYDIGFSPAEIMCALPDYHCRIQRDDTPEKRQAVFSQAMRDGLPVSREQYRHELQIDEPKDEGDVLKGEAVSVPSSGATAGAVDASDGEEAPVPPEKAAPPLPKKLTEIAGGKEPPRKESP